MIDFWKKVITDYSEKQLFFKVFDLLIVKNEISGKRLRAHSKESAERRLFVTIYIINFICKCFKNYEGKKLFKTFSLRELMLEMNKIKRTQINKENIIFSELTKRQRKIIKAFDIDFVQKHSY